MGTLDRAVGWQQKKGCRTGGAEHLQGKDRAQDPWASALGSGATRPHHLPSPVPGTSIPHAASLQL